MKNIHYEEMLAGVRHTDMSPRSVLRQIADSARVFLKKYPSPEREYSTFAVKILPHTKIDFASSEQAREALALLHTQALWGANGFNTFQLSEDLAAAFALTDVDAKEGDFKFPFSAFAVSIPKGILAYFANDGEVHWVRLLFVSNPLSQGEPWYFQNLLTADSRLIWSRWSIQDIQTRGNEVFEADASPTTAGGDAAQAGDKLTLSGGMRIVLNLVRWLDAVGGARSKQVEVNRTTKLVSWKCGLGTSLRTELKVAVCEAALGKKSVEGRVLQQRYIVRGHWRMQPCGPNRLDRKRIFIEPFWRGPEGAEAWDRLYEAR